MAVLTLAQTLQASRIVTSTTSIPAVITSTAQPIYDGAVAMINGYANDAPDSAKNLALERLFGYLWEVDRTGRSESSDPLIQSGAASILNRYRTRRAGAIAPAAAATSSGGLTEAEVLRLIQENDQGGGLTAAQVGHRIAADVESWVLQENSGEQVPIGKLDNIENWAHEGDNTEIPRDKLNNAPGISESDARTLIASWAQSENDSPIPAGKLTNAPGGGSSSEIIPAGLPSVAGKAVGTIWLNDGDAAFYQVVPNTEDGNVYRGVIASRAGNFLGDDTFSYQPDSPHNFELNLLKTSISSPPSNLYIRVTSTGGTADLTMDRASGSDSGTRYAYNRDPLSSAVLDASDVGSAFTVEVFSDAGLNTAYTIHPALRWERLDRNDPNVNPIAERGNTDRWPKEKQPTDTVYRADLPHLIQPVSFDSSFPGFQLNPTSQDRFITQMTLLSPTIDLDDMPHGEFHSSLSLTLTPASDTNAGFKANSAEDRQVELTSFELASRVAALDTFSAASPTPAGIDALGVKIFRQTVYSANSIVGHYNVLLVKDAQNRVGVYYYWDGILGGTQYTISADLRITFWPTDAPATSSGGGGGFTLVGAVTITPSGNTGGNTIWQDTGLDISSYTLLQVSGYRTGSGSQTAFFSVFVPVARLYNKSVGGARGDAFEWFSQWSTLRRGDVYMARTAAGNLLIDWESGLGTFAWVIEVYGQ